MINTHNANYIHRTKRNYGRFALYSRPDSFKRNDFVTVYESSKYSYCESRKRYTFLNTYVWSDIDMINWRG
jgi:hypothetical protein